MAQIPNRLQPDSSLADNLALINDNFDKTVQDMADLGAKFTSVASFKITALAANSLTSVPVGFIDATSIYVTGKVQFLPRVETFVDNDLNDAYLLGYTGSLSAGQQNAIVSVWVTRRASAGTVASFVYQIINRDVAAHDYYVYVDAGYSASARTVNFA